ncbi:enoyl-CoA hydratase-related protein [Gordonia sp. NPDC003376]
MPTAFAGGGAAAVGVPSVRVVVLDAEGTVFCVGGSACLRRRERPWHPAEIAGGMHRGTVTVFGSSIPVMSIVHGTITGGGVGVALCADIVLMA